jgi:hypothetical protein
LSWPAVAANNFLFPSDIVDQAEQFQHEAARNLRYMTQRQVSYPQIPQSSGKKPVYIGEGRAYGRSQPRPRFQQREPDFRHADMANNWFDNSEQHKPKQYKYDDFQQKPSQNVSARYNYPKQYSYPPSQSQRQSYYPMNMSNNLPRYLPNNKFGQKAVQTYQNNFAPPMMDMMVPRQAFDSYSNILYPSDLESKRYTRGNQGLQSQRFNSQNRYVEYNSQGDNIKYVPVPVYGVPGTLPGTVPGVVTPGNMVPGYSHLSPGYQYNNLAATGLGRNNGLLNRNSHKRLNPFLGSYSPFSTLGSGLDNGMGGFPGLSNPFDSFYKSYGHDANNTKPFGSPESMVPGFSMPDMFSLQN